MKTAPLPCRYLAVASLIVLFALNARATIVFQADFNGSGSGTGGATNIVTLGGTGVITNANPGTSNVTVSVASGTPLAVGFGSYLRLNDQGAQTGNQVAGVAFSPTSAASSFDSWYANTSGTLGHDTLNGGFDFFFRTSSSASLAGNTFRFFDINNTTGYRLALASTATNNLSLTLNQANVSFVSASTSSGAGTSVSLVANTTYHIAGTVSTDASGFVTVSLYLAAGNTAIDTSSITYRIATKTSTAVSDATNSISSSFNSAGGFNFGQILNSDADVKTLDLDAFRVYDSVPLTFSSISSIPEPSSMALVMGALIGMGACVARRRR